MNRYSLICACVSAISLVLGVGVDRYLLGKAALVEPKIEQKAPEMKPEVPKDGTIYVWSLPAVGHQSLICLGVVDGNTIDAAYLVPVRVQVKDGKAPGLVEKGGKEAADALEKLLGGQLRTAQLWGPDPKTGLIIADFWIPGEKETDKGQWLSQALKIKPKP